MANQSMKYQHGKQEGNYWSKFQANVKDVLWWAERFGLTPTELKCVLSDKVAITLQLQDSALTTNSESEEKEKLLQVREMYCYTVFKN